MVHNTKPVDENQEKNARADARPERSLCRACGQWEPYPLDPGDPTALEGLCIPCGLKALAIAIDRRARCRSFSPYVKTEGPHGIGCGCAGFWDGKTTWCEACGHCPHGGCANPCPCLAKARTLVTVEVPR